MRDERIIPDMILGSEAAKSLLTACATRADSSPDTAVINGFKAKLFASEMAVNVTNKAIQVMGGHGDTAAITSLNAYFEMFGDWCFISKHSSGSGRTLPRLRWDCEVFYN